MRKKKIILPKVRYENAPDLDLTIPIGLEEEKSLLRNDDRDIVLDLSEQYRKERNLCNRYKLYGKMKMIFRNLYLGITPYDFLKQRLALCGNGEDDSLFRGYLPYNEFAFLRNDLYREVTTEVSVTSLSGFTGFQYTTSGSTEHQIVTEFNAPYHNWNFYLSYVFTGDTSFPMKYTLTGSTIPPLSFVSGDGIPFRVTETPFEYILTSPVEHGMKQGEYILVNTIPFYINSIGNSIFNSENYVINLSKSQIGGYRFNAIITGKRCTDPNDILNSTSQYYVHKHKILTPFSGCTIDKVGFESPIWEDEQKLLFENSNGDNDVMVVRNRMESILFDFPTPFVLTGLTNNLGYKPTELYTTVIFRNGNGYFNYPPKVGYKFHFHDSWVDQHFSENTSIETSIPSSTFTRNSYTFTKGSPLSIGTVLTGAFVEYNPKEMKERIISEVFHKIVPNTDVFDYGQTSPLLYSGVTSSNPVGLYYQPHYRFKIQELSPYVETSNTMIDGMPDNAKYFNTENLWRWRDVYEYGYVDPNGYGVDYPYMNDIHYVHRDINFYLRNEKSYTNKKDGHVDFLTTRTRSCNLPPQNILVNPSPSVTSSVTPSVTPSITPSKTLTPTPSSTPNVTPTVTSTMSITPSVTQTVSPSPSRTPSVTPTVTPSISPSITVSSTPSMTLSSTPSTSVIISPSVTPTITPSNAPIVLESDVLFNTDDSPTKIYSYNPNTKVSTLLNVPGITGSSTDIGHTQNKLWIYAGDGFSEWNITLNPFTAIYNRDIATMKFSSGLAAKDDTNLILVQESNPPAVYEESITGSTGISTFKFNMLSGRYIAGDFIITTTNKVITLNTENNAPNRSFVSQYNYLTGTLEADIQISPTIIYPYGLFEYNGEIFISEYKSNVETQIYKIGKDAPYTLTLHDTLPYGIYGASQVPSYLTTHFSPNI